MMKDKIACLVRPWLLWEKADVCCNSCKHSGLKPGLKTAALLPLPTCICCPKISLHTRTLSLSDTHAHAHTRRGHWQSPTLPPSRFTLKHKVSGALMLPSFVGERTLRHKPFPWVVTDSPRIRWPRPSYSAAARTQRSSVAGKVTHSLLLLPSLSLFAHLLLKHTRLTEKKKNLQRTWKDCKCRSQKSFQLETCLVTMFLACHVCTFWLIINFSNMIFYTKVIILCLTPFLDLNFSSWIRVKQHHMINYLKNSMSRKLYI